ncbi:DUF4142 domain-containing protein [Dactylosporangium sp. CA-052675]|uniref:DUF4142 domain-containing protein n=1 Tax=Dactylosporangium sp. CA-052675 TaxID=3239927 RepID=UPI003D8E9896
MRVPFSVKVCTLAAAVLAAAVVPAPAEAAARDLSSMDRAFVDAAGHGGAYEVAAGRLATDRAVDPAVTAFGRHMVTDHTKAADKLAALAKGLGLSAPDKPDSVQRAILGIWSALSGRAFDCSYAPAMYADHVADVGLFEREAADGQNAKLRAFARDTLPTLRNHLAMAATNVKGLSCTGGPIGLPVPTWTPGPLPWPTVRPTMKPTHRPTTHPTTRPTTRPRQTPTATPTATRTARPTLLPTLWPTVLPTSWPTRRPTTPVPTGMP